MDPFSCPAQSALGIALFRFAVITPLVSQRHLGRGVREALIRQITEDHSWVMEQARAGALSDGEARQHPMRNIITRSIGSDPQGHRTEFLDLVRKASTLQTHRD